MRVRTYAFCVAAALCAVWPASASAAIDSIVVQPNADLAEFLCLGSDTTSPVRLVLTTVEGTTLQTITLPAADNVGDTGCPGSANTFEPGAAALAGGVQPSFHRYPAGARLTATQDGKSVTFALPYGAYSAGTTRLRSLPNPSALSGGVVAAAAAGTYTGAAVTEGDPVTADGTVQDSAVGGDPDLRDDHARAVPRVARHVERRPRRHDLRRRSAREQRRRHAQRRRRRPRRPRRAAPAHRQRLPGRLVQRQRQLRRRRAVGRRARRRRTGGLVPRAQRHPAHGRRCGSTASTCPCLPATPAATTTR